MAGERVEAVEGLPHVHRLAVQMHPHPALLRPAIFQPLRPELFRGETKGKSHAVVGRSWPGIRVGQGAYRDRGSVFGKRHDSSGSYKFL